MSYPLSGQILYNFDFSRRFPTFHMFSEVHRSIILFSFLVLKVSLDNLGHPLKERICSQAANSFLSE